VRPLLILALTVAPVSLAMVRQGDVLDAGTLAPGVAHRALGAVPTDTFRWRGRIERGRAIEIKSMTGEIRAELATGNEVEVVGVKSARRSDPDSVELVVLEHADGVTICAVYPSGPLRIGRREIDAGPNECAPGDSGRMNSQNNDVRVDFLVRVPAGVRLVARAVNGGVRAIALRSPVDAYSVNGDVTVSTSEYAEGVSVNGNITASLGGAIPPTDLDFRTLNGTITLTLPSDAAAEVQADVLNGGSITADFPLTTSTHGPRRRGIGVIGRGGPRVYLATMNGSIRVRTRE
jgi:hypothetical protein